MVEDVVKTQWNKMKDVQEKKKKREEGGCWVGKNEVDFVLVGAERRRIT